MIVAPQRRNRSTTVDLPAAMLPVRATFSTEANAECGVRNAESTVAHPFRISHSAFHIQSSAVWSSSALRTLWQCRHLASYDSRPPTMIVGLSHRAGRPFTRRWLRLAGPPHTTQIAWSLSRSEEHTSELQSRPHLVCRLLLEKKKKNFFVQL